MFRCFTLVLVDEMEGGGRRCEHSLVRLLMFMRWCRVLAGDISLKNKRGGREESSGG